MSEPRRPAGNRPVSDPASSAQQIALFDLDHTLTRRDTFLDFCLKTGGARCLLALPKLASACLERDSIERNTALKKALIRTLFRGWTEDRFLAAGRVYAAQRLPALLRTEALERIRWHEERGHRVIVVSASLAPWIAPWCADRQFELIATGLQVDDGRLTGDFDPPNCHGPEKARRVRALVGDSPERPVIHAYGDSEGDRQLLELADFPYFRTFVRATPMPERPCRGPARWTNS